MCFNNKWINNKSKKKISVKWFSVQFFFNWITFYIKTFKLDLGYFESIKGKICNVVHFLWIKFNYFFVLFCTENKIFTQFYCIKEMNDFFIHFFFCLTKKNKNKTWFAHSREELHSWFFFFWSCLASFHCIFI